MHDCYFRYMKFDSCGVDIPIRANPVSVAILTGQNALRHRKIVDYHSTERSLLVVTKRQNGVEMFMILFTYRFVHHIYIHGVIFQRFSYL